MTSRSTDTVCIQRLGQELLLDPSGAVFWVERRTLFLADLHLGREATFQRDSLALPYGATLDTLRRAREIIAKFQAESLVILGDLIHAPCSMSHQVQKMIRQWLDDLRPVELVLRCFQLTDQCLTLPAFGELTGKKRIQPKVGHRIYATTGQSVFDLTELLGRSHRQSKHS